MNQVVQIELIEPNAWSSCGLAAEMQPAAYHRTAPADCMRIAFQGCAVLSFDPISAGGHHLTTCVSAGKPYRAGMPGGHGRRCRFEAQQEGTCHCQCTWTKP